MFSDLFRARLVRIDEFTGKSKKFKFRGGVWLKTVAAFVFLILVANSGAAAPPNYQLQFLGNGSPAAINNNGIVVGARLSGNNYTPLVSANGAAWQVLPLLPGAMSCFPTDVNDAGVIVGVSFDTQWNPSAVRWRTGKGGAYAIETLPRVAGHTSSYALAINNLGQVVGSRSSLGYSPTGTGWLYSDALGAVDLTTYNFWVYPRTLNDNGIIIGGQERLNLNTGQVDVIGAGPSNYNPVGGVAINNNGQIAGTASLRSSSLNIVSLFRYEPASGWTYLTGTSRYTAAYSINENGDIGYGELGAGIYLEGLGVYGVGSLLDPIYTNQGWTITGSGAYINDLRSVATIGRNSVTGETGGVLLTVIGQLPPPTAPANLTGVAHPGTRMEPFNSINLSWQNTSSLMRSFELQRRDVTTSNWVNLSLIPPGSGITHIDTTVGVAVTYEYRVRAVGLGGPGPWSESVTVTSPTTPLDQTPPTVAILNPVDGANVSGIVPATATATDNVAIEHFEISFWNQYTGQEVILGTTVNGQLTINWDTRGLTAATYRLRAFAYDTMGNWTTKDINVNVGGTTTNLLRVNSITLSATARNTVFVFGRVNIRDGNNEMVRGATVTGQWTLPSGQTEIDTATTGASGNVTFMAEGRRGTFTLRILSVTRSGYTFDMTNSVMTASITR
ncbi:MAG: hypothetical protein IPJ30_26920 [Acidobacteria bacterium]|nr:hypothetical protein [Acidobacteriota bacterium]